MRPARTAPISPIIRCFLSSFPSAQHPLLLFSSTPAVVEGLVVLSFTVKVQRLQEKSVSQRKKAPHQHFCQQGAFNSYSLVMLFCASRLCPSLASSLFIRAAVAWFQITTVCGRSGRSECSEVLADGCVKPSP